MHLITVLEVPNVAFFFAFCYRAKEVLQRRSIPATVTQTDQTQNTPSTSKSDSDLLRENEAIFRFCPPEGNMTKSLDGLVNPAFPFLGCSPDGKVLDCSEDTPFGILEIKCPYKHRAVTPETACHGDSQFHLDSTILMFKTYLQS